MKASIKNSLNKENKYMNNQNSSLSMNAQIGAYPTIYFNAKEYAFKHTTHTPEDKDQLGGAQAYMLCKRSNKRIKRLIFYILVLNISSILFGAARIGIVENSFVSGLFTENPNEDIKYESLWFDAVRLNSIETIELLLLGEKININKRDSDGNTALHIAASQGYKDLLVLLLKSGADISAENNNKDITVDLARKSGNFEIAGILYGKSINDDNKEGKKDNSSKNQYKCDICNKTFSQDGNLITHKRKHTGQQAYKCDNKSCDYSSYKKHDLIRHKRTHTGEKPYKCDINGCGYTTSDNSGLIVHKRRHTGEKPYKCDFYGCNYAAPHKSNLVRHKKIHTGEKSFKSDFGRRDYTTSDKSGLVTHKKIDNGEKPYKCNVAGCGYTTSYQGALVIHKRKHTGEKPYKCGTDGCDFATAQKVGLVLHKSKHLAEDLFKLIIDNRKDKIEELLLIKGLDIDAQDRYGNTALHLSVIMKRKEILEILLKTRADINLLNNSGQTAENLAFDLGNSEFVSIFQRAAKEFDARQSANKE